MMIWKKQSNMQVFDRKNLIFLKEQVARRLLSNLGLKKPLIKTPVSGDLKI